MVSAVYTVDKTAAGSPPSGLLVRWMPTLCLLMIVSLAAVLYRDVLAGLALQWWEDPDYSHGLVIPFVVAYALWRDRQAIATTQVKPANLGWAVMLIAMLMFLLGTVGLEFFVTRASLIVLTAGGTLFLAGREMLRVLFFPISYLTFAIPLPALIFNQITVPLQLLASRLAAFGLHCVSIPAIREGTLLTVPGFQMEVTEACSGIRSLLTMVALVVAYLHFTERRWSIRIAMLALTVPVVVISNAIRVFGAGLLGFLAGGKWADGVLHQFSGLVIFLCASVTLFAAHKLMTRWSS